MGNKAISCIHFSICQGLGLLGNKGICVCIDIYIYIL